MRPFDPKVTEHPDLYPSILRPSVPAIYDEVSAMSDQTHEACCKPGDITVTPIPSGFLIGRVLPASGPGPWWQFVKIVTALDDARRIALELAAAYNSKAWLHRHADHYDEISPE